MTATIITAPKIVKYLTRKAKWEARLEIGDNRVRRAAADYMTLNDLANSFTSLQRKFSYR